MKKKTFIILTVAVLLVTVVIMGIWLYRRTVPTADVSQYNTCATARAYGSALIGQNDILILHNITRNSNGDSVAEFYIYRLPDGGSAKDYLDKTTAAIGDSLELMGTASCTFIGDNPAAIQNLKTLYTK